MFANDPKMAKRWARHTPDMRKLPEAEGDDDDVPRRPLGANPLAPKPIGRVSYDTKPVGSTSVTNAKKAPMGGPRSPDARLRKPDAVAAAQSATDKPKYRGTYVGQQAGAGQQSVSKRTSWVGADGRRQYGSVQGMQANQPWVWDGNDWVKPGAFAAKFPKKNEGVSRTWSVLAEVFKVGRG